MSLGEARLMGDHVSQTEEKAQLVRRLEVSRPLADDRHPVDCDLHLSGDPVRSIRSSADGLVVPGRHQRRPDLWNPDVDILPDREVGGLGGQTGSRTELEENHGRDATEGTVVPGHLKAGRTGAGPGDPDSHPLRPVHHNGAPTGAGKVVHSLMLASILGGVPGVVLLVSYLVSRGAE